MVTTETHWCIGMSILFAKHPENVLEPPLACKAKHTRVRIIKEPQLLQAQKLLEIY